MTNPLRRKKVRAVMRAILERKYGDVCPAEYVDLVVNSVKDDPVLLRRPRYIKPNQPGDLVGPGPSSPRIAMVISDQHHIHHIHEQGYVESPVRIKSHTQGVGPHVYF